MVTVTSESDLCVEFAHFLSKFITIEKKKKTNKNKNPVSWHHLTQMLHCFASKHAAVTWSLCPLEFDVRFTRCSQKYNYNKTTEISQNVFRLMVTFYIRGSKLMLFSQRKFCYRWAKYFILDRPSWNFLLLFLKTVYPYLFTFYINICFA